MEEELLKKVKDTAHRNGISQAILIRILFSLSPENMDKLIAENRYEIVKSHKEAKKQRIADRAVEREKNKELLGKLNTLTPSDVEKLLNAMTQLKNNAS